MLRRLLVALLLAAPAFATPFVISSGQVKALQVSGSPDGTTHAVWTEAIGAGQSLFSATYDLQGTRIGISELHSIVGTFGDIAIASSATETVVVWQEGQTILSARLGRDASMISSARLVAAELKEVDSNLTITQSPDGFLAAWIENGEAISATLRDDGVGPPNVVAMPPPATSQSRFAITSVRIAVGANGGVAAVDVLETLICAAPPCATQNWVGITRFGNGSDAAVVDLVDSRGRTPDVATDGTDFIVLWSSPDGIHERLMRDAAPSVDSLLFARPAWRPLIEWNGSGYTGTWGYYAFGGTPRPTVAEISKVGEMTGLTRVGGSLVTPYPQSLAISGLEPVAAWIDGTQGLQPGVVAVAQFARDMWITGPPPPPPIVTLGRCCNGKLQIFFSAAEADAMWFEIVSTDPGKSRAFHDRAEKDVVTYPLLAGDVRVRVRALNAGGSSPAVELAIPPGKLRAVSR